MNNIIDLTPTQIYSLNYRETHKEDPEWVENKRKTDLESYHRRKNDPINKEKTKVKNAKSWENIKADPEKLAKKAKGDKNLRERKKLEPDHKEKQAKRIRRKRMESPELYMAITARSRAKMYNIPINITAADIVIPKYCPVFGWELKIAEGHQNKTSPSLDKIVPALGYVKGNIQVLSSKANLMKQDCTAEELLMFADWIYRTYERKPEIQ